MLNNLDRFIRRRFTVGEGSVYAESGLQIPEAMVELTDQLFRTIYAICVSYRVSSKKVVVTQVKTKFNWLRVYLHFESIPPAAADLITKMVSLHESASRDLIDEDDDE